MNHEKAPQNGNKIGTEDPSTDWDVGTLQGGNVSERFLQARQSMREGRYDEARRDFLDLSRDNRTRQPTVNWAAYSAALSDLLAGEPGRARETILQMKENPRFLTGPLGHAGPFFKDLADLMLTPWPIPDGELKKMRKHRAWQAGALMIGLKNWEHGRFKSAKFWLDAVQNSKVPGQLRWIEDLSPLFNHYRLDAGTLMSLNTVDDFVKSSDVEIALSEAQTALPKLRTKGRARRWLEARVVSLEKQRDTLATEEARQLAENMAARRVAEMQEISELQGKLELLRTGYQFAEGINEIEALHPLSAEAQSAQSLLLWYWKGAENYLKTLITDITEHGYKGNIRPKAGPVVYRGVSISKATRTSFVVEGSIGVVTIAISKMDAEQLLSLGYSMLEKVQGEKAVMERRRLLALFARQVGETERADSFADALKEDKEFSKSWNDLSAMEAGVTPSSDSGL